MIPNSEKLDQTFPFAHYALAYAQAGDFELLDALELLDEDRQSFDKDGESYPLLYGIWEGERLQLLAYGEDYDDHCFFIVSDLNNNIVYDKESYSDWEKTYSYEEDRLFERIASDEGRDQNWATSVLEKFQEKIKPTEGE